MCVCARAHINIHQTPSDFRSRPNVIDYKTSGIERIYSMYGLLVDSVHCLLVQSIVLYLQICIRSHVQITPKYFESCRVLNDIIYCNERAFRKNSIQLTHLCREPGEAQRVGGSWPSQSESALLVTVIAPHEGWAVERRTSSSWRN